MNGEYYENLNFSHGLMINVSFAGIPEDFPLHWHTFAEIVISFEGSFELGMGYDSCQMNKLDVAICYPGTLHSIQSKGCKEKLMIVQFPFELVTNMNEFGRIAYRLTQMRIIRAHESEGLVHHMKNILLHMKEAFYSEQPFKEVALYMDLMEFFMKLGEQCLGQMEDADISPCNVKTSELIAKACFFISKNCTKPLELEAAANHVGFSKYHFAHTFKKYVNMTFLEFLTIERIKKAEALLANPSLSITEIAMRIGYTNLSTFNRAFKLNKGCTPSEFRRKYTD